VHSYDPYNSIQLVSDFGGFFEFLFITFSLIPLLLNDKIVLEKFVRRLYFVEDHSKNTLDNFGGSNSIITSRNEIKFQSTSFKQ